MNIAPYCVPVRAKPSPGFVQVPSIWGENTAVVFWFWVTEAGAAVCRHNLLYWKAGNWLALGPSAGAHVALQGIGADADAVA